VTALDPTVADLERRLARVGRRREKLTAELATLTDERRAIVGQLAKAKVPQKRLAELARCTVKVVEQDLVTLRRAADAEATPEAS
jgi:hypothetical protein